MSFVEPDTAYASFNVGMATSKYDTTALIIDPEVKIYRDEDEITIPSLGVNIEEIGLYEISFNTQGLDPGVYRFVLSGTYMDDNFEMRGNFELAPLSLPNLHLFRVRQLLYDNDDLPYHVNPWVEKYKWRDNLIYTSLNLALGRINRFRVADPTRFRTYSFDIDDNPLPPQYNDILYAGTLYQCYSSRHTYEISEAFTTRATVETDYKRAYTELAKEYKERFDTLLGEAFFWNRDYASPTYLGKGREIFYWLTRAVLAMGSLRGTAVVV